MPSDREDFHYCLQFEVHAYYGRYAQFLNEFYSVQKHQPDSTDKKVKHVKVSSRRFQEKNGLSTLISQLFGEEPNLWKSSFCAISLCKSTLSFGYQALQRVLHWQTLHPSEDNQASDGAER